MKFRCPFCKTTFAPQEKCACPTCGKYVNIPRTLRPSYKQTQIRHKTSETERKARFGLTGGAGGVGNNKRQLVIGVLMFIFVMAALILGRMSQEPNPAREAALAEGRDRPDGKLLRATEHIRIYRTALELFKEDVKRYPTPREGLRALVEEPLVLSWKGPYVHPQVIYADPWYHKYHYNVVNKKAILKSSGPDGVLGTVDDVLSPENISTEGLDKRIPKPQYSSTLADTLPAVTNLVSPEKTTLEPDSSTPATSPAESDAPTHSSPETDGAAQSTEPLSPAPTP